MYVCRVPGSTMIRYWILYIDKDLKRGSLTNLENKKYTHQLPVFDS